MVEYHVQVNLDAPLLAGLDKPFQLVALPVILRAGGIAGVGGEKAHRTVPPIIIQLLAVHLPVVQHLVKLKNRHQLHRIDPQRLQIGQLFHQTGKRTRMDHSGGGVLGKATDMELIDDEVLHGNQGSADIAPVEVVLHHSGLVVLAVGRRFAPGALASHRLGVGVQQVLALVKDKPPLRLIGAVHPVSVLKLLNVQLEHNHGVHITNSVVLREGEHREGLRLLSVEQQQLNARGAVGVDGEIDAAGNGSGAVGLIKTGPDIKAADVVHGNQMDGARKDYAAHHLLRLLYGSFPLVHIRSSPLMPAARLLWPGRNVHGPRVPRPARPQR